MIYLLLVRESEIQSVCNVANAKHENDLGRLSKGMEKILRVGKQRCVSVRASVQQRIV
jgi:hypothetical protein